MILENEMGHVARKKGMINVYHILVANMKGKAHLEDMDVDGKTILKLIFKKHGATLWIGFIWLRTGTNGGFL
jgi:hypothetical protein